MSINLDKIISNSTEHTLVGPILNNKQDLYTLLYLYKIQPSYKPTIISECVDIEKYAKMKKENDLLVQLIKKLKHKTFIKY